MNLLLDTNIFLWWINDRPMLSRGAHDALMDGENRLYLSIASAWEIAIKTSLGKLRVAEPIPIYQYFQEHLQSNAIELLPISLAHALHVASLPHHHHDPFDRLIIAQGQLEDLTVVTSDKWFTKYVVQLLR